MLLAAFGAAGLVRDIVKPFKTTAELWNRTFVEDLLERMAPAIASSSFTHRRRSAQVSNGTCVNMTIASSGVATWTRLGPRTGKTWCVEIHANRPGLDPILAAVADRGQSLSQVGYYQSLAPPEHGDDPELAEVYCFVGRSTSAND